ncbi:MAG: MFS transporter [Haliscomenobacter sp.]|nr:MFS transporter [Haliscomenobacter sp.]
MPVRKTLPVPVFAIRLAVNLGFSVGPALGGWLAHGFGSQLLFIADGAMRRLAALIFYHGSPAQKETNRPKMSRNRLHPLSNPPIGIPPSWFMLFVTITGIALMQFFSVIPVFWKEDFGLNEAQIGSLLAMNGLIIAFVEMPLVFRLEGRVEKVVPVSRRRYDRAVVLAYNGRAGCFWLLCLSILLVTISEMLNFPDNSLVLGRSGPSNCGSIWRCTPCGFLGIHIRRPSSAWAAGTLGYPTLWYLLIGLTAISLAGFLLLRQRLLPRPNEPA